MAEGRRGQEEEVGHALGGGMTVSIQGGSIINPRAGEAGVGYQLPRRRCYRREGHAGGGD